jgi:hypothetical protein
MAWSVDRLGRSLKDLIASCTRCTRSASSCFCSSRRSTPPRQRAAPLRLRRRSNIGPARLGWGSNCRALRGLSTQLSTWPHEAPQRSRLVGGQPRPVQMIGAPSRQPAVDRLVPPCGWDDGVVGLLQADSNSTIPMSGTFNVERLIHRKLRPHPDGRASPVPAGRRCIGD